MQRRHRAFSPRWSCHPKSRGSERGWILGLGVLVGSCRATNAGASLRAPQNRLWIRILGLEVVIGCLGCVRRKVQSLDHFGTLGMARRGLISGTTWSREVCEV